MVVITVAWTCPILDAKHYHRSYTTFNQIDICPKSVKGYRGHLKRSNLANTSIEMYPKYRQSRDKEEYRYRAYFKIYRKRVKKWYNKRIKVLANQVGYL